MHAKYANEITPSPTKEFLKDLYWVIELAATRGEHSLTQNIEVYEDEIKIGTVVENLIKNDYQISIYNTSEGLMLTVDWSSYE